MKVFPFWSQNLHAQDIHRFEYIIIINNKHSFVCITDYYNTLYSYLLYNKSKCCIQNEKKNSVTLVVLDNIRLSN